MSAGPADPDCAEGLAALNRGDVPAAVRAYSRAISRGTRDPDAYNNLGVVAAQHGDFDTAIAFFQQALALSGSAAGPRDNLAGALATRGGQRYQQGRFGEAAADFRARAELQPDSAQAWTELAAALGGTGRADEAMELYRRAIALAPDYALAHSNLGACLVGLKRFDEAATLLERACALAPGDPNAAINLCAAQEKRGNLVRAEEAARRAVALAPGSAEAHNNLAMALTGQGEYAESQQHFRRAVAIAPGSPRYLSGLLLNLNYDPMATPEAVGAEHRRFQQVFGGSPSAVTGSRRSGRLRIGYLSPDLRRHSVSYFFEPLLRAHRREAVEVFCYADVSVPDSVTARLAGLAENWRVTATVSDGELRALLERDGIDVLVELAGHSAGNRMPLLARRAAPVQMTYLGYPATTGLDTMDARVTDAIADPPGQTEAWHGEDLVRIEGGFLCYAPPLPVGEGPEVAPPPALTSGAITFGSFNNFAKVNPPVLDAWARLLARVPGSRLLLKSRGLDDDRLRQRIWSRFQERGIAPDRIELSAWAGSTADHLAVYHRVDIALDTFPYNGTTTTCEALWMGVPVITFGGRAHAERVGASILARVGLAELAPATVEEYLEVAAGLAADTDRLAELRRTMRPRLLASPLMDGARLARELEAAYQRAAARRQA